MRKMRHLSIALMVTPFLFSGCVQGKVATVSPTKTKSSNLLSQSPQTTETNATDSELCAAILPNQYTEIDEINLSNDTLNQLMPLADMDIIEADESDSKAAQGWQEITKEDEIIATAVAFLDTKYVWAASGPSAFDCSGFTKYVYKENGMSLPRYSGNQAKVGTKVDFSDLQKGDLVFFDTDKRYTKKVNHVGIYMGNGKFIHASSAKRKVIITSFKKAFYKKRFLWGQRVINKESGAI